MKQTIGYTKFAMSYRDMAIVNMAIIGNVKRDGTYIKIAGKPVYEFCSESSEDVKKDILRFVRMAYARETFNVIDRVWDRMKMERSMINYPSGYWLSQVAMVKKPKISNEIKKRLDCLEEAEQSLRLKNLLTNRMEKVLVVWNSALKSLGISYNESRMMTPKEILQIREWKQASTNLDRSTLELQLAMCGVLHFNLQNAPFSEVVKMIEE